MGDDGGKPRARTRSRFEDLRHQSEAALRGARRLQAYVNRVIALIEERHRWQRGLQDRTTVLVVDDEHTVRVAASRLLIKAGYRVMLARGGSEALETIRQQPETVDVLLSELVMPQVTGVQLAAEVQRIQPRIRILLMTGDPPHDALDWPLIVKPLAGGELEAGLRRVLTVP